MADAPLCSICNHVASSRLGKGPLTIELNAANYAIGVTQCFREMVCRCHYDYCWRDAMKDIDWDAEWYEKGGMHCACVEFDDFVISSLSEQLQRKVRDDWTVTVIHFWLG